MQYIDNREDQEVIDMVNRKYHEKTKSRNRRLWRDC
mgnify:CR=1 FL=1